MVQITNPNNTIENNVAAGERQQTAAHIYIV
jgi:hypothetical protein